MQMHPLWRVVTYFYVHSCTVQQQQPGTVTQSCISSLPVSRCLNRPRVALRYSVRPSSYLKQLTCQLPVSSDNNYVCHECIHMTGSGCGITKFSGVLCAQPTVPRTVQG